MSIEPVRRKGAAAMGLLILIGTALGVTIPASARSVKPTVEQLQNEIKRRDVLISSLVQHEIKRRDALISSLVQRVEKLEQQVGTGAPIARGATSNRAGTRAQPANSPATTTEVAAHPEETAQAPTTVRAAPPAPQTPAKPLAPGQFEVSEEAAERALERTLVATGNLIVPAGFAEIEPLFSYTRRETPAQVLFNVNRNELFPAAGLRVGLPWESQIEFFLPYNFQEQQLVNVSVAPANQVSNRWGNAFGDFTVGVAKTFVHESGWIPSLLGRVNWEIPTGPTFSNETPLTSGQNKLGFSLTALKQQDPLVFVATAGYTKAFQNNHVNPGDQLNFTTGVFLATSPETTLRGVLQENFLQNATVNGITFAGSNTVQPILTLGASSILGRGALVDLQVGFGLTNSAPKYQVILSSTYRFGVSGQ
jgi:hypothetical protein